MAEQPLFIQQGILMFLDCSSHPLRWPGAAKNRFNKKHYLISRTSTRTARATTLRRYVPVNSS
jgi:hypothetical protein